VHRGRVQDRIQKKEHGMEELRLSRREPSTAQGWFELPGFDIQRN